MRVVQFKFSVGERVSNAAGATGVVLYGAIDGDGVFYRVDVEGAGEANVREEDISGSERPVSNPVFEFSLNQVVTYDGRTAVVIGRAQTVNEASDLKTRYDIARRAEDNVSWERERLEVVPTELTS